MCGIAGFVSSGPLKSSDQLLENMSRAIRHRGPDDSGFFRGKSADGSQRVGLAHQRLSIIDLDTGRQPMTNEDGTIVIVFNGEIYNYLSLRKDLIDSGHVFRTMSDTEVIIHAYEEYGIDCVTYLRGMFAFAIWDGRRDELMIARDRYGKKPLYYVQANRNLFFASEIKSLLQCPGINSEVNIQSIGSYLLYRYVPGPDTLFKQVMKLPPACVAVWKNDKLQRTIYYSPPDRYARKRRMSEAYTPPCRETLIHQFETLFEEAVAIRMVSDVPFGAFLSGGIDSSAVVGMMSRHSRYPIKTFSVGFNEQGYSELNHARTVSRHFSTDHSELVISESDIIDQIEDLILYRDAPVAEPSDIPIYLLSRLAGRSVKMVLTGEGSDEILAGYPKHLVENYSLLWNHLPGNLFIKLFNPLSELLPYAMHRLQTAVETMQLTTMEERFPRWFGALSPEVKAHMLRCRENHPPDTRPLQFDVELANSGLRKSVYFDQTSWLPDNLLERGDRMTMAASIEARMPFMDHKLIEFVSSLPDRYRIRGLTTKWILREAMKSIIPEAILKRPKIGFKVPVNLWFRQRLKPFLYDHLTGAASMTKDYYDSNELNRVLNEHSRGRQNHEKLLWSLLTLEIWHRHYTVRQ